MMLLLDKTHFTTFIKDSFLELKLAYDEIVISNFSAKRNEETNGRIMYYFTFLPIYLQNQKGISSNL